MPPPSRDNTQFPLSRHFDTFEDIALHELYEKLHRKPSETLGTDSIPRLEISNHCLSQSFDWFLLYFTQKFHYRNEKYIYSASKQALAVSH